MNPMHTSAVSLSSSSYSSSFPLVEKPHSRQDLLHTSPPRADLVTVEYSGDFVMEGVAERVMWYLDNRNENL